MADATGTSRRSGPSPALARLLRLPVILDKLGLGRLLGQRFLIVEHVGRRSGQWHRTPLEVVARRTDRSEWLVIAAWQPRPDWLANIEARPAPAVRVAGERHDQVTQCFPDPAERLDHLAAYAVAHPFALRALFRVFGWGDPRQPGVLRRLGEERVMVAFAPDDREGR